jgi:hypothetical protein
MTTFRNGLRRISVSFNHKPHSLGTEQVTLQIVLPAQEKNVGCSMTMTLFLFRARSDDKKEIAEQNKVLSKPRFLTSAR